MKKIMLFLFPILSIALLLYIEQGLTVSYITKTSVKIILFLVIPCILFYKKGFSFLWIRQIDRFSINTSFVSGFAIMILIGVAFIKLRPFINLDTLLVTLAEIGVTKSTFPFVALYILIGNSLLEEFFFRGLLPSFITKLWVRIFFPSFLFAIYHVAIFLTWFPLPILILAVVGLWIGGIIFQLANEKSKTIYPSWTIHLFADLGVIVIGIFLFYIR